MGKTLEELIVECESYAKHRHMFVISKNEEYAEEDKKDTWEAYIRLVRAKGEGKSPREAVEKLLKALQDLFKNK